jgi:hypothetical protein
MFLTWCPMTFFIVTIGLECCCECWKKWVKGFMWTRVTINVSLWKTSVQYLYQNVSVRCMGYELAICQLLLNFVQSFSTVIYYIFRPHHTKNNWRN